jgi:hypothetical protein
MADTKISALPASTTPLAGTEVLPIVQSGVTKQISVANLTAGRAVSASSVTASTGNFVVGTSGQGIDFAATAGTGTSELLADYEEGTWTPVDSSGAGLVFTVTSATYTKIGRMVYASLNITFPATVNGSTLIMGGLPFISKNTGTVAIAYTNEITSVRGATSPADAVIFVLYDATGTALVNSAMSGDILRATVIYQSTS